ncbi:MAG: RHS repeat protein [Theionarchaea archaeon]|nr:RHS repeat protein [Theionarchaea archaeon]MBU7022458.1 RHS repeat protein [Theionarchaea archaeon]
MTFTNARGYDRIYWYDWLSRLTKVEEEYATNLFTQTTYQYDEIGNLTSFIDAENHTTSYTYGSIFGLTRTTYPDSTYEEYFYDNVGNLASFIDCNGDETEYTYDSLYRVTEVEYEDQSTLSFVYDLNSNRIRMDDDSPGTGDYVEYSYDKWNRVTAETRRISQDSYTVSYQYDAANRLTNLTYPNGMEILYSYDDLNRPTEVKRYVDGSNDEILMDGIEYDTESAVTQLDYGNGLRASFSYDSLHRPLSIELRDGETSYLDLDYTYDDNSNITQLVNGWRDTDTNWNSDTESYSYDGLDRLTSASCTAWSHSYTYDKVGNITAKDAITCTVNTTNEVTSLSDGTAFAYDSNGNRIEKTKGTDTWDYTYDYANRLTKVKENDAVVGEYIYSVDSRRIQVKEGIANTTFIYSGLNILYEENTTGTATYIYGLAGQIAKMTTIQGESNTFYYHTDHLKSTRLVTDESGTIVEDVRYHPFGEPITNGEESCLYTGKERDSTDLYYYGARYYDSDLGRFLTRDPLTGTNTSPQTLNRYAYCLDNPVKLIDPVGLKSTTGQGKMCDEAGICIRATPDGWIATNANGDVISSTDIQEKIDEGDYVGAVIDVLKFLGYINDENDITYIDEKNFTFKYEGRTIQITVYSPEDVEAIEAESKEVWTTRGETLRPKRNSKDRVFIRIYFKKGENGYNMTFAELFHTVGHEMEHAKQFISGIFYDWEDEYTSEGARALSESEAYRWNLLMLPIISFPGAAEMFSNEWLKNITEYQKYL